MRKNSFAGLILTGCLLAVTVSGCSSTGKKPKPEEPAYMKEKSSSKSFFARERERRAEYERNFRDTRHRMNQDEFKVMPWSGKHYQPRSEKLHDASLQNDNRLFNF